ncbi:MAG: hypothetical protein ACP5SD_05415 [Elusimicrobiales bacterium]
MKKIIFVFFVFLTLRTESYSDITLNTDFTYGKYDYKKYYFSLEFSTGDYYITPSYSSYSSDLLYSRKELSLKAGYENEEFKISADLGYTPESDGYSSYSFGLDICYFLENTDKTSVGIGAFINYTLNKDSYLISTTTYSSGKKSKPNSFTKTSEYELGEKEIGIYMENSYKSVGLDLSYSKTTYSDPIDSSKRPIQKSITSSFITEGYIDKTYSVGVWINVLKDLKLKSDYSLSEYVSSDKGIKSLSFEIQKDLGSFSLGISYETDKDDYYDETEELYGSSLSIYF